MLKIIVLGLTGLVIAAVTLLTLLAFMPAKADEPVRRLSATGDNQSAKPVSPPAGRPGYVKVLTYNIRHGARDDWQVDLERLADIIRESGADVVALQEVDRFQLRSGLVDQAEWLGAELGMEVVFGANLGRGFGQYGNAILSRYPILSVRNVHLPGRLEQRGALVARLQMPEGPVTVLGTHLGLSQADRVAQVKAIMSVLTEESGPKILLGDWNTELDAPELEPLRDSHPSALKLAGVVPAYTFRADGDHPYAAIDQVFVSPGWRVTGGEVLSQKLSDHFPVLIELYRTPLSGTS